MQARGTATTAVRVYHLDWMLQLYDSIVYVCECSVCVCGYRYVLVLRHTSCSAASLCRVVSSVCFSSCMDSSRRLHWILMFDYGMWREKNVRRDETGTTGME